MQTTSRTDRRDAGGYALAITIVMAAAMLAVFASMMYWVSSNAKVTLRNNQYNMSQAAAEAVTERVLAQMDRDFMAQSISNSAAYTSLPATIDQSSWPVKYKFTNTNGTVNQVTVDPGTTSTNDVPLDSQYAGLYGLSQTCTITAIATPTNQPVNVPAKIVETVQFATIPVFQFAIFYNVNMEVDPGSAMTIRGPVFCNASIWEGSSVCTFQSTVYAVGTNNTTTTDYFAKGYTGSGGPTFSVAGQPIANANPLTMPVAGATNSNATNIETIINLPPPAYALGTSAAYSTNGQTYLANEADLYITNTPSGTNAGTASWVPSGTNTFIYFQDKLTNALPFDYYILKTLTGTNYMTTNSVLSSLNSVDSYTNVRYAGYSFVTNVLFYDWREGWNAGKGISGKGKTVQAVQFDVFKFNKWVTNTASNGGNTYNTTKVNDTGHPIDGIFVYNAVPLTNTILPAVRIVNGTNLFGSKGFALATPMPIYVLGNFNIKGATGSSLDSSNTAGADYPAALYADAITVLSTSWSDTVNATNPASNAGLGGGPVAGNTTINAGCFEGIVPSNPAISGNYSGGVENFLRLLESWSSKTLTYNGSVVVMFPSVYATNSWEPTGNYYNPPSRNWGFDANFATESGLPPMYPGTKAMIRGSWTAQ